MTSTGTPYRFESSAGYSIISLQPELNDAQWSEIEKIGTDILGQLGSIKSPAFIVDLSSLTYMGSAMVALIVRLWKSVKEGDGNMVVVNKEQMVFEVLKLAGLHNVWSIVETREQAVAELGMGSVFRGGGGTGKVMKLVGIVVVLAAVGGAAYWLGSQGNSAAVPIPQTAPADDESSDEAQDAAPAEEGEKQPEENAPDGEARIFKPSFSDRSLTAV